MSGGLQPNAPIATLLARTTWRVRPERFVVAGIGARELPVALRVLGNELRPFGQIVVEPDMVTLVLKQASWRTVSAAFPQARVQQPFRAITFEVDFSMDVVGFLAAVSAALAAAEVPLLAVCGFTKDHVLVHERNLAAAVVALETLTSQIP